MTMNQKTEQAYDFVCELKAMCSSREAGYGFTETQLEKLAEKSGVSVSQFRDCFFEALKKIAE